MNASFKGVLLAVSIVAASVLARQSIAMPQTLVASVAAVTQSPPAPAPAPAAAPAQAANTAQPAPASGGLNQADLQELMGPIALYPDELLANVLAATVYPQELTAAQTYLDKGGDAKKVTEQEWESPVKTIANIPDVLKFLTDNMEWTTAVGQAYIIQSADVMTAVQALRKKAQDSGALKTSPQQTVVTQGSTVIIEPADPQIIYVPQYNPQVVYVDQDDDDEVLAGLIGFGVGVAVGACFNDNMYCHWGGGCVGWGWGGHSDIDIDRNVNIETGDININSGNTITGGDRTNVKGGDRNTANVGREGQKWEPNAAKSNSSQIRSGGASQLNSFKGASATGGAQQARVPKNSQASSGRQSPGAVTRDTRPQPSQGGVKSRQTGGSAAAAPKTGANAPAARPSPPKTNTKVPTPKTSAPKAPAQGSGSGSGTRGGDGARGGSGGGGGNKPSGFSPDSGSNKASQRGSNSRSSSSGARSSGGSRSGGGSRGGSGGGRR